MRTPYLIQRCTINTSTTIIENLDSILDLDYMGSVEFEFGGVQTSLRRIRSNNNVYNNELIINNKRINILCYIYDLDEVVKHITNMSNDLYKLKEPSNFARSVKYKTDTNFWWDIDNDFMFWVLDDIETNNKLINAIKPQQKIEDETSLLKIIKNFINKLLHN